MNLAIMGLGDVLLGTTAEEYFHNFYTKSNSINIRPGYMVGGHYACRDSILTSQHPFSWQNLMAIRTSQKELGQSSM